MLNKPALIYLPELSMSYDSLKKHLHKTYNITINTMSKPKNIDYAELAENNYWGLDEDAIKAIENGEDHETGKWTFKRIGNEYEAVYEGLYMHVFGNLQDFLSRENEKEYYEYNQELSEKSGEETFATADGKVRKYAEGGVVDGVSLDEMYKQLYDMESEYTRLINLPENKNKLKHLVDKEKFQKILELRGRISDIENDLSHNGSQLYSVSLYFKDNPSEEIAGYIIKQGDESDDDENIFHYVNSEKDLKDLMLNSGNADFVITSYEPIKSFSKGGALKDKNTYVVTGGGFAEPFTVTASDKKDAIKQAQETLRPIYGSVPANRLKVKLQSKAKSSSKVLFENGEIVWDAENKTYGVILNNFNNDDSGEVRLDSDGVQSVKNLHKLGSKGDKGTKEQLVQALLSHKRLIDSWPGDYDKVSYAKGGSIKQFGNSKKIDDVIEKLRKYVNEYPHIWTKNGKNYVPIEGWQYAAMLMGYVSRVVSVTPVANGYQAQAEVIDETTGTVVCSGFGIVMRDEPKWANKPDYQLAGFAQTRAVSRALRNCISWVIKAAGYSTTPAEEMYGVGPDKKDSKLKKSVMMPPKVEVPDNHDDIVIPAPTNSSMPILTVHDSGIDAEEIETTLRTLLSKAKANNIVVVSESFMDEVKVALLNSNVDSHLSLLKAAVNYLDDNGIVVQSSRYMANVRKVANQTPF